MNIPCEIIYESPPCEHYAVEFRDRGVDTHPPTLTHDRTIDDDIFDALYAVFGCHVDPNAPSVSAAERRALRRALRDRSVDPTRILKPRVPEVPRVPAINTFELRDNHTAYDDPDSEVA